MSAPTMTRMPSGPWTDEQVEADGLAVKHSPLVSIGGGLASFALVDRLRVAGVPADDITVVSPTERPDRTFAQLCGAAGLADDDSLRSDSSARIDNIWGFPGYAVEHAWRSRSLRPLARVLLEPVMSEYYTPSVGMVRAGLNREAARIDWASMVMTGTAIAVRPRASGGYFVVVRAADGHLMAYRCSQLHLGLGYGSTPAAGSVHNTNRHRHVYQPHDHIYRGLAADGGGVVVRGEGMAASRVLQRLIDDRDASGQDVRIWHVFRDYQVGDSGPIWFRRRASCGFRYSAFTFPKSASGGQLADRTRALDEAERIELIKRMGATSTPYRRRWADQLRRGREEGWYQAVVGDLTQVTPTRSGVAARAELVHGKPLTIQARFVIDATGVDPGADHHPLLTDLVSTTGASASPLGGLRVGQDFAVLGADSGDGRIYASGVTTLGGPIGPVDSFLGMHHAAMTIADALADNGFGNRLTALRSLCAWGRWLGGRAS